MTGGTVLTTTTTLQSCQLARARRARRSWRAALGGVLGLALALAGCAAAPSEPSASSPLVEGCTPQTVAVAALKGPTGMGIAHLASSQPASGQPVVPCVPYSFQVTLAGTADEITPKLVSGDLPLAAVPVNLAAVLYAKTQGQVQLAAVNTLGVLYVVTKGVEVSSLADLAGKTVYSTGKGTTPQYVLDYLLGKAGITGQVDVQYLSEATEVASRLAAEPSAVAVLPEPYVTTVTAKDASITVALDLTQQWDLVAGGSQLVTGGLVVRKDWADANPDAYAAFMAQYAASVEYTNASPAQAAEEIAALGIVPSAAVAQQAIPRAHIVLLSGGQAEQAAQGYLQVLYQANPASVGGALPDDGFFRAAP